MCDTGCHPGVVEKPLDVSTRLCAVKLTIVLNMYTEITVVRRMIIAFVLYIVREGVKDEIIP